MNVELLDALDWNSVVSVTYMTKKNTERTMECTRYLQNVPLELHSGINSPILNGPLIIPVYDLVNKAWRSFRWDSIIEWKIL